MVDRRLGLRGHEDWVGYLLHRLFLIPDTDVFAVEMIMQIIGTVPPGVGGGG